MQLIDQRPPPGYTLDFAQLSAFETHLDPANPEDCSIPHRVLGYGEISTVCEIHTSGLQGLAFKRMALFENPGELAGYLRTYNAYNRTLEEEIGIQAPAHGYAALLGDDGRPIFYIIQERLDGGSIACNLLHTLSLASIQSLVEAVLSRLLKVWTFNRSQPRVQVGIDGQISNWAVRGLDPQRAELGPDVVLIYIDNSSPLIRVEGVEQLDPELFLRAAPSFLAWILRRFFLQDVLDRYYDPRRVIVDLIANFHKEGRADLIPDIIRQANRFLEQRLSAAGLKPISEKEVDAYYREDALIWRLYSNMRRLDRFIQTKILRKPYPYILPGKVKR